MVVGRGSQSFVRWASPMALILSMASLSLLLRRVVADGPLFKIPHCFRPPSLLSAKLEGKGSAWVSQTLTVIVLLVPMDSGTTSSGSSILLDYCLFWNRPPRLQWQCWDGKKSVTVSECHSIRWFSVKGDPFLDEKTVTVARVSL